jgi:hypothetical protein
MTRLFGINGVNMRRSEIYIESKKGISCNSDKNVVTKPWVLGRIVQNSTYNVDKYYFFIISIIKLIKIFN